MCKISLIIPVYNAEKTLNRCVESVLKQSYADFELLLVDDGSTDTSGTQCDEWAKRTDKIRAFHQNNAGVSSARNVGINQAQGEYICFVDSDDWVKVDYLLDLYNALMPCKESVCLVIHGFERADQKGNILSGIKLQDEILSVSDFDKAFTKHRICKRGYACSKLYQLDVLNKQDIRFSTDVHCCEDLLFMLEYLFCCEYICWGSEQNYIYTVSEGSLSVRINSFESEYACLTLYTRNIDKATTLYALTLYSDVAMFDLWNVLFERTVKSNYLSPCYVNRKRRVSNIKKTVEALYTFVYMCYNPTYKIDKIGRFFLINRCFCCYDIWMYLIFKLGVKSVFLG